MASVLESEVKDIVLSNATFGPREIQQLVGAIHTDVTQFSFLRDAVAELEVREDRSPAAAVRLGVCYFLLGRFVRAEETLSSADGSALALFYLGKAQLALEKLVIAVESLEAAKKAGYDGNETSLAIVESHRSQGTPDMAMTVLDTLFGPVEQTSEYLYQRGATVAARGGNPEEVIALYERAIEADAYHPGALFGMAIENDRRGNDQDALDLYQRAANCFPTHVGAVMNLGILYEDMQEYERAQHCYQRVLDAFPSHQRAQLYLRDAVASSDMLFDEAAEKAHDRLAQVLNVPVADFELSVRSRNCLQTMGVNTLGDLSRTSEQELLASKNFGETSLVEIRDMLASKGLELGQFALDTGDAEPPLDVSGMSPDEQALLERPISDLNLSVRARKCMVRMGLSTVGELVRKTGDDLLECKNFGVTSLNEVREKLTEANLRLRGD